MLQLATDKSKTLLSCPSSNPPTASIIERPEQKWRRKETRQLECIFLYALAEKKAATAMRLPRCHRRSNAQAAQAPSKHPLAVSLTLRLGVTLFPRRRRYVRSTSLGCTILPCRVPVCCPASVPWRRAIIVSTL